MAPGRTLRPALALAVAVALLALLLVPTGARAAPGPLVPRLTPTQVEAAAGADNRVVEARLNRPLLAWTEVYDRASGTWIARLREPGVDADRVVATVRDADARVLGVKVNPDGRRLTQPEAERLADASAKARDWIDRYRSHGRPVSFATSFDRGRWTRRAWSEGEQIAEVVVDDRSARVVHAWTGPQVAWHMARGSKGAFGRKINEPWILLPIVAVFVIGLVDLRRLRSWRTLDVLVLASFVVSLLLFNQGLVFWSVPLAYPPLLYLFGRLLAIGLGRRGSRERPLRWPLWLVAGLAVFALGFRAGLNFWSSNVIDVGYASVVGADRILDGQSPYGHMPKETNRHCGIQYNDGSWQAWVQKDGRCESAVERGDTYGPSMYPAYVPFTAMLGWSGLWDDLPAAHGTAVLFDALAALGLALAGFRLGGRRLAAAVLFLWAAFPFTTYAMSSNSNDAVPAAFLAWGLALFSWPRARGLLLGLAALAKFAPLLLVPLCLRADRPDPDPAADRGRRARLRHALRPGPGSGRVVVGLLLAALLSFGLLVALDGPGAVQTFWDRTFGWQLDRPSPFSIWDWGGYPGFPDLAVPQKLLKALLVVLAVALYLLPRRLDIVRVAALSGALLVGFQLLLTHWFYLYLPWFVPFLAIALLAGRPSLEPAPAEEPRPVAVVADEPTAIGV